MIVRQPQPMLQGIAQALERAIPMPDRKSEETMESKFIRELERKGWK
jgi:hypothetical protein